MRPTGGFAEDVRRGLRSTPKQLDPKYFYDALGSHLFEAICQLPWYPLTRAETTLLTRHAAEMVAPLGDGATLVELGCGSGQKVALLAEALCGRARSVCVHLVDISATALELSARTLGRLPRVEVVTHRATYEEGVAIAAARRPPSGRDAAQAQTSGPLLVLFLGSNIGNLDRATAEVFLRSLRDALRPGDALLLGADLVKPAAELVLAYDDPLGVTAAFNKNLLARINRELGGDFDLRQFDHKALWNAASSRVEMHLVSRRRQVVRVSGASLEVAFVEGEGIWTESSYKYTRDDVARMGERAGFRCEAQWIEPRAQFSTSLLVAVG